MARGKRIEAPVCRFEAELSESITARREASAGSCRASIVKDGTALANDAHPVVSLQGTHTSDSDFRTTRKPHVELVRVGRITARRIQQVLESDALAIREDDAVVARQAAGCIQSCMEGDGRELHQVFQKIRILACCVEV